MRGDSGKKKIKPKKGLDPMTIGAKNLYQKDAQIKFIFNRNKVSKRKKTVGKRDCN